MIISLSHICGELKPTINSTMVFDRCLVININENFIEYDLKNLIHLHGNVQLGRLLGLQRKRADSCFVKQQPL